MDAEARDRIQHVVQDEAEELFPGAVRGVTLLQPGQLAELDERFAARRGEFEPGELVPQVVFAEPPGIRPRASSSPPAAPDIPL